MAGVTSESKYFLTRLNGENFHTWKIKIEMILLKEGVLGVITEDAPEPITEIWKKKEANARATIVLSLEDTLLGLIDGCTNAREMWKTITSTFQHNSLMSKTGLRRDFYGSKKKPDMEMAAHINQTINLANRLRHAGDKIFDEHIVSALLCSLPPEYDALITALDARDEEDLTLEFVKLKLIDEANRKEKRKHHEPTNNALNASAEIANKTMYTRKCYKCGKAGHLQRDCRQLAGSDNRFQRNYRSNQTYDRYDDREQNGHERATCSHEVQPYQSSPVQDDRNEINEKAYGAFSAVGNEIEIEKEVWLLDSGANAHMSGNKKLFGALTKLNKPIIIKLAGGENHQATATGTCIINTMNGNLGIQLKDVLFIPTISVNLISLGEICQQGYEIMFNKGSCLITKNNISLLEGSYDKGLYIYHSEIEQVQQNGMAGCVHQWHNKLGHRSIQSIIDMSKNDVVTGLTIEPCEHPNECEGCNLGGMINLPFKGHAEFPEKKPFKHLYSDVCGEITPKSLGNGRYFVTITDHYSKYCHVEIMKHKDDTASMIVNFIKENHNKYGYYPISLTTDGGGEYNNHFLNNFLKHHGIAHRYSIPYCPAQNGISERKNRTLITMVRSMLVNKRLPNHLWGEAVVCANHISNRVRHTTTKFTPIELWNGNKPDLKEMYEFGSVVYSFIDKSLRKKLDNTSDKGIFLGYCTNQRGYRVWLPLKGRVISSRNIRVTEESFDSYCKSISCKVDNVAELTFNDTDWDDMNLVHNLELRRSNRITRGIPPNRMNI